MTLTLVPVNLPVRLQCLHIPVIWRVETVRGKKGATTWFLPDKITAAAPAASYDPWEMRDEFQRLKEGDNPAAIAFLNSVGLWNKAEVVDALTLAETADSERRKAMADNFRYFEAEDGSHMVHGSISPTESGAFWLFRKIMIREMKGESPRLGGFDKWEYAARFAEVARRGGPSTVITTIAFTDALAASIRIDQLCKARGRKCKRPDCPVIFAALASQKRKKFCTWYCGHIESVRKSRRKK